MTERPDPAEGLPEGPPRGPRGGSGPRTAAALLLASRPKTLPAATAPVLVGSAVAWDQGGFALPPAAAALAVALLVQIGANYANDYFDFVQGADTDERIGPTRVVQAGLLSPRAMLAATAAVFALAMAAGLYLVLRAGWPMLWVGLASIAAALWYTAGGRWSMGYLGLGDPFAFLFFGPVAVATTCHVQTLTWPAEAFYASLPVGFLTVAILVVNNVRDIPTDRASGKRTLAVRLGRGFSIAEWSALVTAAFLAPLVHWGLGLEAGPIGGPTVLLPLLTLPLALPPLRKLLEPPGAGTGPRLNRALAETARLLLVYGLLYALGIAL